MVDAARPSHPAIPHRVPPSRQQIIAQVLVSAVILVSGVVIGGGGTILALKDRILPPTATIASGGEPNEKGPGAGGPARDIVAHWTTDYGLSETQAQQARETLTKQFEATHALWRKFQQAEQGEREKFALAMKGILTSDQYTRWDADFKRMVEDMQRMRPFDPHRGGRGGPRPDWRPERRMDPNDQRRGWRPGPPGDPNGMRKDWPRDGFRGQDGRRGEWGRGRPRDPNAQRERRLPEQFTDPNGPPPGMPPEPR